MFNRPTSEPSPLDAAISDVLKQMEDLTPDSEEYTAMVNNLVKLHAIKTERKIRISPDVMVTVAANLVGVIAVINHEHTHALTSKALGLVMKTKS